MSSRKKRIIRDRIAKQVMKKKCTPDEGRRALAAAGIPVKGRKAAPVAAKSAAPQQRAMAGTDMVYKGREGLTPQQRNYLEIYDTHSSPAEREAAFQAAYPKRRTA